MNKIGDTLIHFGGNEEIVQAFLANRVEFIVIGGLAVAWYCSSRQADDMDLLVNPTIENSERIYRSLLGIHLQGFESDSFARLGLQAPLKQRHYAELLTPGEGGLTYLEVARDTIAAKLFHLPILVPSARLLIMLKEQVVGAIEMQRLKHLKDIEMLRPYV